ncbi:hypothetical protein I203_103970 [Kwoniella mangroviensis CBS 8507]|uniref:uncharacterized protein n=1 Tax=Kwoniella mangroviensis CBS 8507 TaxID=1296122 RepID=UPI00303D72AF
MPCKLSLEDEEHMRRNAQRVKLKQQFSSSSMTSRPQTKLPFAWAPGPRKAITREYSILESDSEIEDFQRLTLPDKRFNVYSQGIHPGRRSVRLALHRPSFALKQIDEAKSNDLQDDEVEGGSGNAQEKGKGEMKEMTDVEKHVQKGITAPQDEDDMTVWQLGFLNLSRAIHEHREIDNSFLKLDLNLKVRDYRAAQASGNGGSTAIIEAFPNHEAEEEVSTASEVQKQIEGRDHDKPGSRGEEQVRSTAVKDRGDDEVVIEVQIGRGEVSEIVLDLSAMEARRVKVRVKRSE